MAELYIKGLSRIETGLIEAMENMDIIDGHEHVPPEETRTSMDVDVFTLFAHYTKGDLMRAGMSIELFESLFDGKIPLETRWQSFKPHWDNIRHTSYSRAVLIAARKFYGAEDINEKNYCDISERIKKANRPGLYKKVFKDACRIRTCLNQCGRTDLDPSFFTPVMPLRDGMGDVRTNPSIKNLDDYASVVENNILRVKKEGAVGLKMKAMPYSKPDRKEAELEFAKIRQGTQTSASAFENYTVDRAIAFAGRHNLTIAVHTGYWGDFRNLHPLHMIPLLQKYPGVRFDIYHLGYPWVRDTLMLAKGFSNVWLNLCWTYIISQKCATEALDEAVDTVPSNKVIGFGGDYNKPVEDIYGHLVMARESIAKVLGGRIKEGTMTEKEALAIIKKWLWDNPVELYGLDMKK